MLSKAQGERFKIIAENTPQMNKALQVLFQYILNGRLHLKDRHMKKLKPHRNFIRNVADAKLTAINRKLQTGGSIFQKILTTVLPLLAAIL